MANQNNATESEFLAALWSEYSQRSQQHVIQGNDIIVGVGKLLLSGGAFSYLLTSNIFDIRDLNNPYQQCILILSWVLIFISFIAGTGHLISESTFSGKSSNKYASAASYIKDNIGTESAEEIINKTNEILGKGLKVSDMHLFWAQAQLLFIALLLQLVLSVWIMVV